MTESADQDVQTGSVGEKPPGECGVDTAVRIGLVGIGQMGRYRLEQLSHRRGCSLVAVHDVRPELPLPPALQNAVCHSAWSNLLNDARLDVVWLATPPGTHALLATDVLKARKHVVIEPPLALSVRDVDQLRQTAEQHGRAIIDPRDYELSDDVRLATECQRAAGLGSVRTASQYWSHPGVVSVAGQPTARSAWRMDAATGGGSLWSFGANLLDELLRIVADVPVSVHAVLLPGARYRSVLPDRVQSDVHANSATIPSGHFATIQPADELDASFALTVRFSNGAVGLIQGGHAGLAPVETGWVIEFENGAYAHRTRYTMAIDGETVDVPLLNEHAVAPTGWDAFPTDITAGNSFARTADVCRRASLVVALIAAARVSSATGRVMPLNSQPG